VQPCHTAENGDKTNNNERRRNGRRANHNMVFADAIARRTHSHAAAGTVVAGATAADARLVRLGKMAARPPQYRTRKPAPRARPAAGNRAQKFHDQLERKTSEFEVKLAKLSGAVDVLSGKAPLHAHLDIERETLHRALGEVLATERAKFGDQLERKTSALEIKLAKLSGAVDILSGKAPPRAEFPSVKAWEPDVVFHENDVVTFAGSTYQALRDTARVPTTQDWRCLVAGGNDGRGFVVRGTYDSNAEYHYLDVVALNGSSFVALKNSPSLCPGDDWQLLASRGSRGHRGESGERGIMGMRGEPGLGAPLIRAWEIDRARYTATPIMSDGSRGPTLELRALYEQFLLETAQ
jgi:hypothetical protein